MLTTADVEQKTFSTALRGYDLDEVDDFLDEIVATIRELTSQLEEARSTAAEAPAALTPIPTPEPLPVIEPEVEQAVEAPQLEIDESAIGRALVAAQEAADRLLESARSEAGKIVDEAKTEADSWSADREAKRREAEAEMSRLTIRVASIRSELSILAGEVAERLDEMDSVIGSGSDAGTGPGDAAAVEGVTEPAALPGEIDTGNPDDQSGSVDGGISDNSDEGSGATDHLDAMLSDVVNDLRLPGGGNHQESGHDSETSDGEGDTEPWDEGHEEDE
jgi:DivIVA domain-containing protein